jgi:paraquat-inducible protein B
MSKPANKSMIGAFVVGAVVMAVVAIVLFGSGRFFKTTETWLTFFDGSVKGLNVGSPVVFRGVEVGQVTDIIVGFDATAIDIIIPVIFETDPEKFRNIGPRVQRSEKEMVRVLVERGLRAQLQMQSLVTGQLVINLDFLPNTPARLKGIDKFGDKLTLQSFLEIPSVPTPLQRLEKTLENISFEDIADDVRRAMDGIAKLVSSDDLHASIGELKETLIAVKNLSREMSSKVEPLATSIDQTLVETRAGIGDARHLIGDTRKLITNIDRQTTPLMSKIQKAVESTETALDQADTTLKSIENIADEGSELRHEISATLREISAASRSMRVLADFIEQHPDAILRGRVTRSGGN